MAIVDPHGGHPQRHPISLPPQRAMEDAAAMFRALADPERLRLLIRIAEGEVCVSELAEADQEKLPTTSARLQTLHAVRLVTRRREAKHVYYRLADEHVLHLVRDAIAHAAEGRTAVPAEPGHGKDSAA